MRFISQTDTDRFSLGPRMKILNLGLSRCATSSVQKAFEMAPFNYEPCMHMAHILPCADRLQLLCDALHEKDKTKRQAMLHRLYDGYEAACDFPMWLFSEDLLDMYPDAAIVLSQRKGGAKAWQKSYEDSFIFFTTWWYFVICYLIKTDRMHWKVHQEIFRWWREHWGLPRINADFYDRYQEHIINEAKRRDRKVLVWKAEDGWEPLCEFVDKEVPDIPFPWINDTPELTRIKLYMVGRGLASWSALFAGVYVAARFGVPRLARLWL